MVMAFRSATPHIAPSVLVVSYSGPSPCAPCHFLGGSLSPDRKPPDRQNNELLQPEPDLSSPGHSRFLSCSKVPDCQLCVGYPPRTLTISASILVPNASKPIFRIDSSNKLPLPLGDSLEHFCIMERDVLVSAAGNSFQML